MVSQFLQAATMLGAISFAHLFRPPAVTTENLSGYVNSGSGIRGRVVNRSCPVIVDDNGCPATPLRADLQVYGDAGVRMPWRKLDSNGRFSLAIAPGNYVVEARYQGMVCTPVNVSVPGGHYANIEVVCNSGVQ